MYKMKENKPFLVLTEANFSSHLTECNPNTQTGKSLKDKYQLYLVSNPETVTLVNNFVQEAQQITYDTGIVCFLEALTGYINENKASWQLATLCETFDVTPQNVLTRRITHQLHDLLEHNEPDVLKYVKAGVLKNSMYNQNVKRVVENICQPSLHTETNKSYKKTPLVSIAEKTSDDTFLFTIDNCVYEMQYSGIVTKTDKQMTMP